MLAHLHALFHRGKQVCSLQIDCSLGLQASDRISKPVEGNKSILRLTLVKAADISADNVRPILKRVSAVSLT